MVLDVPSTATARVRELSRGSRRKTDLIDAAAAASVAALQDDVALVAGEDHRTVFAMLEERRANLAAQLVRVANQLHAVLRVLIPGGAALAITAKAASTMLRSVRPASVCERTRKKLARDLVRDLRTVDSLLSDIEQRMSAALDEHGTRLHQVDGVGAVTAVRLIGRTGHASRFATADAFATYAGVAPIEVASGDPHRGVSRRCRSPCPVSVGVRTSLPSARRSRATSRRHQPPCIAQCTRTNLVTAAPGARQGRHHVNRWSQTGRTTPPDLGPGRSAGSG
jgi:transposase